MMKRYSAACLIAALLLPSLSAARAQEQSSALPEPFMLYHERMVKGDYLGLLLDLQRLEEKYKAAPQRRDSFLQLMSVVESQVGDYATAHAYLDQFFSQQEQPEKDLSKSPIDDYQPRNAIDVIRSVASKQQVIMINEEHDTPMHRAFTTRLLPVLYAKGFRYLAAETLADTDLELNKRGYPTHKSGFYLADPVYGDMIRTALKLGFKVVPYEYIPRNCKNPPEHPDYCQNERERGQAQNLYDRIFRQDPQAKVLVHVGRGHNQEINAGTFAMMGWHFKGITKIDPFTINQMHMSERSRPEYEAALYRYAVNRWRITEPTVFQSKDGKLWGELGNDLVVFHPRTRYDRGRPTWLQMGGRRKPVLLDGKVGNHRAPPFVNAAGGPVLVQAFVASEGADAIPIDQIVVTNPKAALVLVLPRGKFRVRAVSEAGKVISEQMLTMN